MLSFFLFLSFFSLIGLAIGMLALLLQIGWYLLLAVGRWRMFEKMGEPGWKGLVPFYADYTLYKNCWQTTGFWVALAAAFIAYTAGKGFLASAASLVLTAMDARLCWELSRKFDHGLLFAIGLVLFNPFFVLYLGFGPDSCWRYR
ncbi:MAG: hypothetical protein IJT94_03330 [Oscillibacter sp.]|nr:hypothetical protein [Oscillibacter sp.]